MVRGVQRRVLPGGSGRKDWSSVTKFVRWDAHFYAEVTLPALLRGMTTLPLALPTRWRCSFIGSIRIRETIYASECDSWSSTESASKVNFRHYLADAGTVWLSGIRYVRELQSCFKINVDQSSGFFLFSKFRLPAGFLLNFQITSLRYHWLRTSGDVLISSY